MSSVGPCGFQSTATRESLGTISLSSSSRFPASSEAHLGQPRDVAAGPRQALNQPTRNRVTRSRHNDRDCPGSVFGSQSIGSKGSDDDVNLETDEIGCEVREAIASTLRIAVLDADVLSLDPSEVAETLPECLVPERGSGRREWREKSYPRDFPLAAAPEPQAKPPPARKKLPKTPTHFRLSILRRGSVQVSNFQCRIENLQESNPRNRVHGFLSLNPKSQI